MTRFVLIVSSPLRPNDETLSEDETTRIQLHRLASLLGAVFILGFGMLSTIVSPEAPDSFWIRLVGAGLFLFSFAASYVSARARRAHPSLVQGLSGVVMGWISMRAALNHFSVGHTVEVLVAYAVFAETIEQGVRSVGPAPGFSTYSCLLVVSGLLVGPPSGAGSLVVLAALFALVLRNNWSLLGPPSTGDRGPERQQAIFETALQIAGVGVWVYDVREDRLTWTDETYHIHGRSVGSPPTLEDALSYCHSDDRPTVRAAFDRAVQDGAPYDLELRIRTEAGRQRWVCVHGEPQWVDGNLVCICGTVRDITERKETEATLRRTKNFYEQLLEETPVDLAIFSPEATFEYIHSKSVGDSLREWLIGRTNVEYCRERDLDLELGRRRDRAVRTAAREKRTTELEEEIETEHGTRHYLRLHRPVIDLEGTVTHVAAFGIEITERKEREQALRRAKERAEAAQEAQAQAEATSRAKSTMLANMSHEIRTPLTSVIGFAEAIGDEVAGEGRVARFASLIEKSAQRLLSTLDGVLNLSKLETDEMSLEADTIDLSAQAEKIAAEFRSRADSRGLRLQADTETPPVQAWANEGGVQIILQNLVSNAIKYTDEGTVWIRVYRGDDGAVLEVADTGIGMDPAMAADLFEPFRQASEGWSREYEGTGVGLAVTKEAVEKMDGRIDVETEKGEGSRFTVRLPLAE